MAHHKRGKPKSSRAGCLLCKPHKHQGNQGSFNARSVQEKRELQDEIYPKPRRSRRKNTRVWCKGKVGREHKPKWTDKGRWWNWLKRTPAKWVVNWRLRCTVCGKELGYWSRWGKPHVVIHKFPGWERFENGPPL